MEGAAEDFRSGDVADEVIPGVAAKVVAGVKEFVAGVKEFVVCRVEEFVSGGVKEFDAVKLEGEGIPAVAFKIDAEGVAGVTGGWKENPRGSVRMFTKVCL